MTPTPVSYKRASEKQKNYLSVLMTERGLDFASPRHKQQVGYDGTAVSAMEAIDKLKRTYSKLYYLLKDHPDLQPLYDDMTRLALFPNLDREKHSKAKEAWEQAIRDKGLIFRPAPWSGLGFPVDSPKEDEYASGY